jgi:hypothetical protein
MSAMEGSMKLESLKEVQELATELKRKQDLLDKVKNIKEEGTHFSVMFTDPDKSEDMHWAAVYLDYSDSIHMQMVNALSVEIGEIKAQLHDLGVKVP